VTLRREWTWSFDAPRERVWPYLADTNEINRLSGLPPIAYAYEPQPDGSVRARASLRYGPLRVEWDEPPFAWSAPEYHDVERRYRSGPLKRFRTRTELADRDGSTDVRVVVELEARSGAFAPFLPAIAAKGRRGLDRAMRAVRKALATRPDADVPTVLPPRFAPLVAHGFERDVVARFARFLSEAEDAVVARMRPFEVADRLGFDRRTVLRMCLSATRLGLLDLSWSVLCSSCGGSKARLDGLEQLGETHCDACDIRFDPIFDRSVEVTFDAKPLGRTADVPAYCFAGPGASPHVVAQIELPVGSSAALDVDLARGHYLAHAMGGVAIPFASDEAAVDAPLRVRLTDSIEGVPAEVRAGRRVLAAVNGTAKDVVLRIESAAWPDTIATAAQVTAMQEFRDLFASDVLAPGVEVAIRSLAILFTDVVGSTAMYRASGDAPAFRTVSDHFDAIRSIVAPRGGAIVKTIGDAVMAVFEDPAACFDAAIRLDAAVSHLRCGDRPVRLRVGFHAGPCIAMRANDRLDYFGTTVNLAARLEGAASQGEVAMAASDAQRPDIAAAIAALGARPQRQQIQLKGIERPIAVVRVNAKTAPG